MRELPGVAVCGCGSGGMAMAADPVTKAMIEILGIFTDVDYRSHGITLKDLGMEHLIRDQIISFVTHGTMTSLDVLG